MSPTGRSGSSMAAKGPPRSNSDQCTMLFDRSANRRIGGVEHERWKLVRLTPRGQRTFRSIQSAQRVWANRVGGEVGEADLRHASRVVDRLEDALKSDRAR